MSAHSAKRRGTVPKLQKYGPQNGQNTTEECDFEKEKLKKDLELCRRENMMLRKNLNMREIMEELKKAVAVNNMEQMFFESLHELQHRLQQYESDPGANESLKVKDLQKELERERALSESNRKEVHIKNSKINDLEKSLDESKSTIETLNNKLVLSSQTIIKLQQEKSALEVDKKNLTEEITILKAANVSLKAQVRKLENDLQSDKDRKLMSLTEEMSEIETLRQELRERDQTIDSQKEQITQLETTIIKHKRLYHETEASFKELEKTTDSQNDRLGELNKDKEQLHVDKEVLISDLNKLRSKCEKQSSQIDELTQELEKTNELNHAILNELSELRKTTDSQNDRLGELNKDKEQLHVEKEVLISDLNELRSKCEKQSSQIDELTQELDKTNELSHAILNELSELRETNANNEIIIQELEAKCLRASEAQPVVASIGEDALREEITKLKIENAKLKSKKEELEFTCHDAFEQITQKDKRMKLKEDEYKKNIERRDETIQKLRIEQTMVDPTKSNASVAEVNALKDKLEKLSKELIETNAEIAMLRRS